MRKNKNTSKIILTVIVAGLATMISYTAFNNMNNELTNKQKLIDLMQNTKVTQNTADSFAYAVATKDLKAGEIVADGDVDFKQFEAANASAFDNRSDVVNKVLLQDIASGETFTTIQIAKVSGDNLALKNGYRSLTLPADNFQGKSSQMIAGSNVDIFSASKEDNWSLENVKILSFESSASAAATAVATVTNKAVPNITNATSIDFEVPAESIADFISNVSKGKLILVARNPNDKAVTRRRSTSFSSGDYRTTSMSSLPKLPPTVPIKNLQGSNLPESNLSGLPLPIKPSVPAQEVEMIEANVKSKVTFD